jgi:hypothetical protein
LKAVASITAEECHIFIYVYMASFGYLGILGRVPISMYVNLWHGSSVYSSVSMATFGLAGWRWCTWLD